MRDSRGNSDTWFTRAPKLLSMRTGHPSAPHRIIVQPLRKGCGNNRPNPLLRFGRFTSDCRTAAFFLALAKWVTHLD